MVKLAWDYKWSSAHTHIAGEDATSIIKIRDMLDLVGGSWKIYLEEALNHAGTEFEIHEKNGGHSGSEDLRDKY